LLQKINKYFYLVLVINKIIHDSLHNDISSSDDEFMLGSSSKGNTPDTMRLSSLSSCDDKVVENDPNIPPLPNFPPQGYYDPSQFNNHYGYQYFQCPPNYQYDPPLPRAQSYEPELLCDRPGNKNFPAELKKYVLLISKTVTFIILNIFISEI